MNYEKKLIKMQINFKIKHLIYFNFQLSDYFLSIYYII